ncbi:MAG: M20 family metallopeptidase [Negativicutes bacterium]|nr:M20 family metallopeptidase [Negativicutes bacterium]
MSDLQGKALQLNDYLIGLRRHFHQYPELGFKEIETTKLICQELTKMNIDIIPLSTGTGVLGLIHGTKSCSKTRVTALRADIDALPITEQTGLEYASKNKGVMHSCGHDGHTAVLLGVAKLLSSMRDQFSGVVKFIFQPAEELLVGAVEMIRAGVLDNPEVDTIVTLHGAMDLPLGSIGVLSGPIMASGDKFTARIIGKGVHGAYPHRGQDCIVPAAHAITALQYITSREIDAVTDRAVLSVCEIHGGQAFNILPAAAEFIGTVRCFDPRVRNDIHDKMLRTISHTAHSFGCDYEFNYEYGVPPLVNHPEVIDFITAAAQKVIGVEKVIKLTAPLMGSEDFSRYLEKVPFGAMFRLGIGGSQPMIAHSPNYDFADDAISTGVAVMSQFVLERNC